MKIKHCQSENNRLQIYLKKAILMNRVKSELPFAFV